MNNKLTTFLLLAAIMLVPSSMSAAVHDKEKEKLWLSMENGPWDFAPGWYYYFLHQNYSGAYKKWQWRGFKSGYVVKFDENKSNIKRIMPVRVLAEETQRQKLEKVEEERKMVNELYNEEVMREADRAVDVTYSAYKDEFNRMQNRITDGLLYCMQKSDGKLKYQVDELSRQNEIICENIAYIHKQGAGYGLENTKRQQAYEEAKEEMSKLVSRTAHLALVASTMKITDKPYKPMNDKLIINPDLKYKDDAVINPVYNGPSGH